MDLRIDPDPSMLSVAGCAWLHSSTIQNRELSSFWVPGKTESYEAETVTEVFCYHVLQLAGQGEGRQNQSVPS